MFFLLCITRYIVASDNTEINRKKRRRLKKQFLHACAILVVQDWKWKLFLNSEQTESFDFPDSIVWGGVPAQVLDLNFSFRFLHMV